MSRKFLLQSFSKLIIFHLKKKKNQTKRMILHQDFGAEWCVVTISLSEKAFCSNGLYFIYR